MKQLPMYRAEIRFQEVWRDPRRLFGYAYPYFLLVLIALGYLYIQRLTDAEKNSVAPVVFADTTSRVLDIPYQTPQTVPPLDVMAAAVPTRESIARGREVFRANCSSCHGDNGMGDGPAGLNLTPKPRNFHSASGWTNGAKVTAIYQTLHEGIVRNGMPSFSYLSPQDRFAVTHFVRSLNPTPPPDVEADLALLENTFHFSKGFVLPGQVPISVASTRVEKEAEPLVARVMRNSTGAWVTADDEAARLLRTVVADPHRVFAAFPPDSLAKGSLTRFIQRVAADPMAVGFRATVLQLGPEQWKTVFSQLAIESK
jgi:mono/diheme cytochrome c family protein